MYCYLVRIPNGKGIVGSALREMFTFANLCVPSKSIFGVLNLSI